MARRDAEHASGAPATRVSAARDLLAFVDKFEPGARARVLDSFPAASREALETSPRTSWLPLEHDHFVVDGVIAVLGKERALACWRGMMWTWKLPSLRYCSSTASMELLNEF